MDIDLVIEGLSVLFGIIYIFLITREKRSAWIYGILSSFLAIYLFVRGNLYSESILYSYYVLAGIYGYIHWGKDGQSISIEKSGAKTIISYLMIGILGSLLLGYFFTNYSNADLPYFDATTTIFSFVATFMATRKIIQNWILWIAIDLASIVLYGYKGLYLLAALMFVYSLIAVYGYHEWNKRYAKNLRH